MTEAEIRAHVRRIADAARSGADEPPIDAVEALAAQVLVDLHRLADAAERLAQRP